MKVKLFDPDSWREIVSSLSRNKTRTFLTAFGIFWGTAMLALLLGAASGFTGIMRRTLGGINTNIAFASANKTTMSYRGFNKGTRWSMTDRDVEDFRRLAPAIEYSSPINWFNVNAVAGQHAHNSLWAIGVEPDYAHINRMLMEGRFINESDMFSNRKVAVIGRNLAAELYPGEDPIGKDLILSNLLFTVVGVAGQIGEASIGTRVDDSVIIPATTARRAFQSNSNIVDFFVFTAPEGESPSANFQALRRVVAANHPIHPDDTGALWISDASQQFEQIGSMLKGLSLLALFVGAGTLFAGVIGVGNIMWIVVKERTQEFGIRRAIGAKPIDLTLQILSESIFLTFIAGMAGVCFAVLILGVADHLTTDPVQGHAGFEMPFGAAIAILFIFMLLGAAAGLVPALRAMKIKPVEAMRDK